jgi:hypothetical protein
MIDNIANSVPSNVVITQASKKKLGEILVEQKLLTKEELEAVLAIQRTEGGRLGDILVKQKLVSMEDLLSILSVQFNVPVYDLKKRDIKADALASISEEVARKNTVIPLEVSKVLSFNGFPDDVRLTDFPPKREKNSISWLRPPRLTAPSIYLSRRERMEQNLNNSSCPRYQTGNRQ